VSELQKGIGQTGRLGEFFIVLALMILVFGIVITVLGETRFLSDGTGSDGGNTDAVTVGWLFVFEGLGFTVFGLMIVLAGWARHHDDSDW
jgi:hypothetical protein